MRKVPKFNGMRYISVVCQNKISSLNFEFWHRLILSTFGIPLLLFKN